MCKVSSFCITIRGLCDNGIRYVWFFDIIHQEKKKEEKTNKGMRTGKKKEVKKSFLSKEALWFLLFKDFF